MYYCQVALDTPLKTTFTYTSQHSVLPGVRVVVPFRKSQKMGLVISCSEAPPNLKTQTGKILSFDQIKALSQIVDTKPFVPIEYLDWLMVMAEYYYAPLGQVLAQAIPSAFWEVDEQKRNQVKRAKINTLPEWSTRSEVVLTDEQKQVVLQVNAQAKNFFPVLLQGVTGSGKTEIYIEIIRQCLARGESALYLVPEIGLTPQTLGRLNAHFEGQLLVFHSGLTENQRYFAWKHCLENKPHVMVGTRSALFAPFSHLGVIIIDEEHDSSYKQEDRFRYHARDSAVWRAQKLGIPVVLGSATPSLESYHLAKEKKYHHFILENRLSGADLPRMDVIDMNRERLQTQSLLSLSKHIHRQIDQAILKNEQVIIFVGKRGFAQNAFCTACQKAEDCPNCSVGLKHHAPKNSLKCHYCDFEKKFDEVCVSCKTKSMTLLGMGIQAIEAEMSEQHPNLKFVRVDSDAFPSSQKLSEVFVKFKNHEWDLILGTQMMTKGHDFANVSFVGVAGIESQLGLPDFRASERAFQTVVQVAGRAGRNQNQGLVLVQSYMPEHPSLKYAVTQDYTAFANEELKLRQSVLYPPYTRLVQFKIIGNTEERLLNFIQSYRPLFLRIKNDFRKQNIDILGPVEMPIYKLRGLFRYHLIFKMPKSMKPAPVLDYLFSVLQQEKHVGIDFQVDVDPQSLI